MYPVVFYFESFKKQDTTDACIQDGIRYRITKIGSIAIIFRTL